MAFSHDLRYGFRSYQSTVNSLTVVSDRIARDFKRFGATPAVALDTPNAFDRFSMLVVFAKLSLIEFLARYLPLFCLNSVIDDFKWIWMGILHKNIQFMLVFLKAPF